MDKHTNVCVGCGDSLPAMRRQGNPRKWCSEKCRVRSYRERNPEYRERCAARARERAFQQEMDKLPRPRCSNCDAEMARRGTSKFCTKPECQAAKRRYDKERAPVCSEHGCERPVIGRGLCGPHYAAVWRSENPDKSAAGKQRYRARKRDAWVEDIDRSVVFERDRWRCGICGERIPKRAKYPDPQSASIDHVVPLSRGGKHEMRNVQASHLLCNALKRDTGAGDQLALI